MPVVPTYLLDDFRHDRRSEGRGPGCEGFSPRTNCCRHDQVTIDRRTMGRWAFNGAAGLTFAFVLVPLFFVTWLAFFRQPIPSFPPQGYSLQWFVAIGENPRFVQGFWLSLQIALIATLTGLSIGVPAALCLALTVSRGVRRWATCCCCLSSCPGSCSGPRFMFSMSRSRS